MEIEKINIYLDLNSTGPKYEDYFRGITANLDPIFYKLFNFNKYIDHNIDMPKGNYCFLINKTNSNWAFVENKSIFIHISLYKETELTQQLFRIKHNNSIHTLYLDVYREPWTEIVSNIEVDENDMFVALIKLWFYCKSIASISKQEGISFNDALLTDFSPDSLPDFLNSFEILISFFKNYNIESINLSDFSTQLKVVASSTLFLKKFKRIKQNYDYFTNLSSFLSLNFQGFCELISLKKMVFTDFDLINIKGIDNLTNLEVLDLHNNKIEDIRYLQHLDKLCKLDLRNNPITILPDWITDFPKMDINWGTYPKNGYITLFDNPIENIPIEIIKQGKAAIKTWFEEQKKTKTIPNS